MVCQAAAQFIHSTLKNSSMTVSNVIGPVEQMALANHPCKGLYFMVVGVPQVSRKKNLVSQNDTLIHDPSVPQRLKFIVFRLLTFREVVPKHSQYDCLLTKISLGEDDPSPSSDQCSKLSPRKINPSTQYCTFPSFIPHIVIYAQKNKKKKQDLPLRVFHFSFSFQMFDKKIRDPPKSSQGT